MMAKKRANGGKRREKAVGSAVRSELGAGRDPDPFSRFIFDLAKMLIFGVLHRLFFFLPYDIFGDTAIQRQIFILCNAVTRNL